MEYKLCSLEELEAFAKEVLDKLKNSNKNSVVLKGDLGAGKTAFVKKLGKLLGVNTEINSPTFVIMREYETNDERFKKLIHIDAYRMESKDDLKLFSVDELVQDKNNLLCIEWAEKIEADKIENSLIVELKIIENECRLAKVL